jgi:hypothetical protein
MKLSVKSLTITSAVLWGGACLMVAVLNIVSPGYGNAFLDVISSIYPGYQVTGTLGSVIVGTLYALLDGAVGGALFGWIYNCFAN